MSEIDEAFQVAQRVIADATSNLANIVTEEDAKLQIIVRFLIEVLGWSHSDIPAERQHENGFSDLIVTDRSHQAFVLEAKRIGRISLNNYSDRRQYYKISGPALRDAVEGIRQAASYCTPLGIQLAVLTDGITWIVFLPYVPGAAYLEKQAIVFPTFASILDDFVDFYSLLSKSHSKTNTYKLLFDKLHENRLTVSTALSAAFGAGDIHIEAKSALAFDLEKVFSRFFSGMSGDSDTDLLIDCFVETRESRVADFALERITSNVLGNIAPPTTSVDEGLSTIVRSTVEGELGQTIFIVGPSGAGKTTFLDRFFRKTLSKETRDQCVVININALDATGDSSTAIEWMRESAISRIEQQIYEGGHPDWNSLLALYHTEYVRRSEGVDSPLYNRDKEAFREKFSIYMDERVEKDREGYLTRLLADVVRNRKKLPVFIIDNTDEFSPPFKEQVFQYFQALRRSVIHCLLVFPATDRSAWAFSKTEIFNIYTSRSFFLPTPSPREVFRKRVAYLKEKLQSSAPDKTKANYFSDRGIKITIPDLEGFASVVENIFVDQDYAARRIGEIANYNIRKTLALSQRIITSSVLGVADIIRSYVTGQIATPTPAKFMNALLKGDHSFYRSEDDHGVFPLFQVDSEIRQSPLLHLRVLTFLADIGKSASEDKLRYVEVKSIYNFFELMSVPEPAIERSLSVLLSAGLLEPYDLSMREYSQDQRLAITYSGACHLALARNSPTYFEQMALTTRVPDEEVIAQVRGTYLSGGSLSERMEQIRATFAAFLSTEDQRFLVIPETAEFRRQASMRSEIVSHWAGGGRADQEEEMALYGAVEENIVCKVDWFDRFKGYGFVKVEKLLDGAFLHARVLEAAGVGEVQDGDDVRCDISRNDQGLVVSAVYEIVAQKSQSYRGKIVYLNEEGAYGFVNVKEVGTDAFLRYSLFPREARSKLVVGMDLVVELVTDESGRYRVKRVVPELQV